MGNFTKYNLMWHLKYGDTICIKYKSNKQLKFNYEEVTKNSDSNITHIRFLNGISESTIKGEHIYNKDIKEMHTHIMLLNLFVNDLIEKQNNGECFIEIVRNNKVPSYNFETVQGQMSEILEWINI